MKVNKKLIRLFLIIIMLFTKTLSVYALDPNSYITGENNNEEQQEVVETPTEEEPQEEETTEEVEDNGYDVGVRAYLASQME